MRVVLHLCNVACSMQKKKKSAIFFHLKIMFFKVFLETAHELMVIRKLPNAHPRPHLVAKEPTDLLNWSRPVLKNKYSNPIVLMAIEMVTGPTLNPLFPDINYLQNRLFVMSVFEHISNARSNY